MKKRKLSVVSLVVGIATGISLAGAMYLAGGAMTNRDNTASGPVDKGSEKIQGSWALVSWSDAAEIPEVPITLIIESPLVFGVSACNNYSGPITIKGDSWKVGELATTMMYCMDTAEAETTYLALFNSVDTWFLDGGSLVLTSNGVEVLRFDKA
ncbi:MAG: META domain-containing protein [Propionibacteriaceae bacterium]|jgi:heat shock protein HslJ|nr:META domain-containing protein [Propionibacteriaceae bacterium]